MARKKLFEGIPTINVGITIPLTLDRALDDKIYEYRMKEPPKRVTKSELIAELLHAALNPVSQVRQRVRKPDGVNVQLGDRLVRVTPHMLKAAREQLGLSQKDAGRAVQPKAVSQTTVANAEKPKTLRRVRVKDFHSACLARLYHGLGIIFTDDGVAMVDMTRVDHAAYHAARGRAYKGSRGPRLVYDSEAVAEPPQKPRYSVRGEAGAVPQRIA